MLSLPDALRRGKVDNKDSIEDVPCYAGKVAWKAGHQQISHSPAEASIPLLVLDCTRSVNDS